MKTRYAVIAVGLAFGIWEAVDTTDTGIPAAVFAALFLVCVAVLVRRSSRAAAVVVAALCTVEATQAHTWKDAGAVAKDAAMALGTTGILASVIYLLRYRKGDLA